MNNSYMKTALTDRLTVITEEGEVPEESVRKYRYLAKSKEEFYLVFSSLIGIFKRLNSPEVRVYCYLLENYQVESPIAITNKLRALMAVDLILHAGTIANALGTLTEKKLIYSKERGLYKLNPRYAFQGSTAERNKMLKMILELECPDC